MKTIDNGTTRVYLELFNSGMIDDDRAGNYKWYLVYWTDEEFKKMSYFRVYYSDATSTIVMADIPTQAKAFKFVRIGIDVAIEDALKGSWELVNDESISSDSRNLYLTENNLYTFTSWGATGEFIVTNNSSLIGNTQEEINNNATRYGYKSENYLVLSNYGENTDDKKYVYLDENLGYSQKDLDLGDQNSIYKLEFTKFGDFTSRPVRKIPIPKGTIIEARVENFPVIENDTVYFDYISYPNAENKVHVHNDEDVALTSSEYFGNEGGKLVALKDVVVEVYLRVTYDESSTNSATAPNDFEWHFTVKNEVTNGKFDKYDLNRAVFANEEDVLEDHTGVTYEYRDPGNMTYPYLEATETVIKLQRNYANTDYEEYKLLSDLSLNGSYVISPYYETDRSFGANTGSIYYGIINNATPSGELILTTENLVSFTPNGKNAYEEKYYAAFDDYDNFLTFLTFNRTQTINEGYQVLSAVIPQALLDFQNIKIYEVNSDGTIKNSTPLNADNTDLSSMLFAYNEDTFANEEDYIEFDESNELLFDYYFRNFGESDAERFYTNNLGFTTGTDDNGDTLYYFNNIKLAIAESTASNNKYQITTSTNISTAQQIANNSNPLDEQIIDGYYYNGICSDGNGSDHRVIRFLNSSNSENGYAKFEEGYYNLVLRKRIIDGETYLYLGYQYLGETIEEQNYYLYIYQNDVLIDTVKMDSMYNANHYYGDVNYDGNIKVEVYNEQKVCVYYNPEKVYTSTSDKISRFYYGVNTPIKDGDNLYEKVMGKIVINFNIGIHPTDDTNIRYSPVEYSSQLDHYEVKVQAVAADKIYYAKDGSDNLISTMKKYEDNYSIYVFSTEFNKVIKVYENNDYLGDENGKVVLPQPGNFKIVYNSSTGKVSCYKVQESDIFYLNIDGENVVKLEVNENTSKYYEYKVEKEIVLEEDLIFSEPVGEEELTEVTVVDIHGNVMAIIESVTLENQKVNTRIEKGAYYITYSVDSSRRENDVYHVFTYLNFTPVESNTVTFNYKINESDLEYTKVVKTVVSDEDWNFDIFDLDTLAEYYTPVGTYFAGWSTTEDSETIEYEIGSVYGTTQNLVLYPVYKDRSERHKVIWLKEPNFDSSGYAIFSLTNLETTIITDVTYSGYDTYVDKYVTINTSEGSRIVTVDQSLFEVIGYVHGGIKLVVHLESTIDGKTSTCTVKVDYPNYDDRNQKLIISNIYFDSSEYSNAGGSIYNGTNKVITSLKNDLTGWSLKSGILYESDGHTNANVNGTNYCLRIRPYYDKELYNSYAKTNDSFANIRKITFYLKIPNGVTTTQILLELVDSSDNVVASQEYTNSSGTNYELKEFCTNLVGEYYIRFVPKTTGTSTVNVHIDDITIMQSDYVYKTKFTSNEYASMGRYTTEETLIESNNDYALDWYLLQSRFGYEQAYGNDGTDKSNLALVIRKNEGISGYAYTANTFTSLESITLDLKFSNYTNDKLTVSLIKVSDDSVVSTKVITNDSNDYETILDSELAFNYSGEAVYSKFAINTSTDDHMIYIDNLKIQF